MTQRVPEFYNFVEDVVGGWAKKQPGATALWWVGDHGEQRAFTFAQMSELAAQAAGYFQNLGIRPGDRVQVILQRVPQWWIAMLGLIRSGIIPVPGTPLLTAKDIRYRLKAASISAIITDAAGAANIPDDFAGRRMIVGSERPGWDDFDAGVAAAKPIPYVPTRSQDPALIYFTSGTAGEAKMVVHTHVSYGMGHRITGGHWLDLKPGDIIWALADTGWGKTAWSAFFGPWIMGATAFTVDMRGKFDPQTVLKTRESFPITVFCAPATALRLLVRKELKQFHFPHLRHCVSAGEALNPPVLAAWQAGTGLTLHEGYGQTECVLLVGQFRSSGYPVKPGSMGRASPGFELAILDEDLNILPDGQAGTLAIRVKPDRPIGLFKEYWRNPEENALRFRGDWYLTGDSATRDADGYFWFVGRADDIINSSSYRIGPSEVESALLEHPAVLEAGAIGVPEEMRGEVVKAYVVLRDGYEPGDSMKHELQTHCKRVTAPYKYPRQIEFIAEMPKTPSGKIRRRELRDRDAKARGASLPSPSAPGKG